MWYQTYHGPMEIFAPACPAHTLVNADKKLIDSQLQDFPCLFERRALQRTRSLAWDTEDFLELFHLERADGCVLKQKSSQHTNVKPVLREEKETQGPSRSRGRMHCRDLSHGNLSSGWRMGVEEWMHGSRCLRSGLCLGANSQGHLLREKTSSTS